jgi:hypothetical protein
MVCPSLEPDGRSALELPNSPYQQRPKEAGGSKYDIISSFYLEDWIEKASDNAWSARAAMSHGTIGNETKEVPHARVGGHILATAW